ncbi:hypothetical protein GMORB2_1136 [Geosmithia morbida]|uniref:Gastric mucin-like protein n=1 Tax=Geosmithia morbida TaxID=1094350 RepID=A0A9P4Z1C7_9HYPO|nr:uncharacterized protein GMORB2_1136 [Geosmithia morbida]KAF4125890.1 hypothetical protein GMORB2_1136 [Geosmithia morbida]
MSDARADSSLGSIVAFEGHPETISTHLRLLPTSPQILILPNIRCYLPTPDQDGKIEVHDFIRRAHDAVKARNEIARSFLQSATAANKRLVFMDGGTPSAQCLCIRHIMKYETEGDDSEAEAMFNFLVKDGLAGLEAQSNKWYGKTPSLTDKEKEDPSEPANTRGHTEPASPNTLRRHRSSVPLQRRLPPVQSHEDPITRAMRAAEALDRQTENLQPSNDLDLTTASRRRSVSLPMCYADNFGDNAPFYVFGGRSAADARISTDGSLQDEEQSELTSSLRFSVAQHENESSLNLPPLTAFGERNRSPSCVGESYFPTFLHHGSIDADAPSISESVDLRSSAGVVFGEASLVDMRPAKSPITRVKSLDRIYTSLSALDDLELSPKSNEPESASVRIQSSQMVADGEFGPATTRLDLDVSPRTVVVQEQGSGIVNLAPVPAIYKRKTKSFYVDRGTDAEAEAKKLQAPFLPVLPMTEDLVVHLREEVPDALLDRIFNSFREGNYPVLSSSSSPDGSEAETASGHLPSTPDSNSSRTTTGDDDVSRSHSNQAELAVASPAMDADEYDPFAYMQKQPTPLNPAALAMKVRRPPTPDKTPAPSVLETSDGKFHEFKIASDQTPVAAQNSLRSTLKTYFPPEAHGYHQFRFALLPELEGLWKPIFREAESGSPRANDRRMDQIVAIGSQKGVRREFSSSITGLLDKLGSKPSGVSRSGRLDFRYLLANAIQAFTSQPLANQASDNPFNNPHLLATLIVPHMETYLALHSEVRYLLLEYPPEHLSTVLALQRLVGVDLMKVAQIVDSKNTDLGPFTHIRDASVSSEGKSSERPLGRPAGVSANGTSLDADVSKANFLLTSEASETGISNFIATIGDILMSVSQFYMPDEVVRVTPAASPEPSSRESDGANRATRAPVLSSRFSHYGKLNGTITAAAITASAAASPAAKPSSRVASPAMPSRSASISETVRTQRTSRTARSTKTMSRHLLRPTTADGAESFMTFDPADDSDYDMEERRLMPIFMQKPSRKPKPNTRKALKFLGLA